ncbi:hypothetical protein P3X46_011096 [Hevea brasiliensis]|uniref:Zinc knuckle CX2CX4HX4C domain-containing protein n=1 Tax=Hevea brasiliensis TaxID=3981 RepID=A0ABQ9MGF6_HEVBR|nr:hypothetical protein P3X46_011096 [Hevea brasiliensis]
MACSSSDSSFADEFYAHLNLEEQQGRVEFMEYDNDGGEKEVIESPLCVMGRLLTEKPMNFVAFKQTMVAVWRPVKGMMSDQRNYFFIWLDYMRIKVTMDVNKPLKRKLQMKHPKGEWEWVDFKYERLSTFCFFCGYLGHSYRFRAKLLEHPEVPRSQFAYGPWLRADNRHSSNVGERWLLSESKVLNGGQNCGSGGTNPSGQQPAGLGGLDFNSKFESPNFVTQRDVGLRRWVMM